MSNQEQLAILKQGVTVWNEWRRMNLGVDIDLSGANLTNAYLSHFDFNHTNLSSADLSHAKLGNANFSYANLSYANLTGATLFDATFNNTNLSGTNLSYADLWYTIFGEIDLSTVKGLEVMYHAGPSIIGIDAIIQSQGKIPQVFLRNAGVPLSIIEQIPALIRSLKPIDYYSCFISYSSKDEAFAKRLYADLQNHNVRCWFAPEDLKWGDKIRTGIDVAIRIHDKLLLVLSENSVESTWVEKEVETAFDKEAKSQKLVLFPVRLDNAVMETNQAWAADIRRMRNIGDFTRWKNHDDYEKAFTRLLRDLKSEAMTG